MTVMSPTWGFWRKRMVRGEGAWAKRALTTRNGTRSGSLCCRTCSFISRTSPALDPRDYTCWRDAYATGRLHPNPRSQPRSVWKSRYGERAHTHIHTHRLSSLLTHTHTHTLLLQCFSGLHVEILSRCIINVPFSLRLVWNISFTHVSPPPSRMMTSKSSAAEQHEVPHCRIALVM